MARHETEALWALAAGELETEARDRVEAHVAECPACTRQLVEAREARELLRRVERPEPRVRWAEVDDRVLTLATRRIARSERWDWWPWGVATLWACAAAVLILLALRSDTQPLTPPVPALVQREEAPPPVPTRPVEATPSGPTVQVEGTASAWVRETEGTEQVLKPGVGLRAGTAVRTPPRGSARLRLPDASRMQVSADSEVLLSRVAADDVHLRVVRGRVAVQASHAERRGFVVEAAGLRAVVVGTVFSVEHTPSGAVVSVLEGKVRVEAEGQAPRLVAAGEHLEWHTTGRDWKHRALSAQDRRAFEALGVRVKAPAPPLPSLPPRPAPEPASLPPPPVEEASPAPASEAVAGPAPEPVVAQAPTPARADTPPPAPSVGLKWQGSPAPREVEERFLRHAREELNYRACESFLVGLGEIADQSRLPSLREEARYLRARCFETRFSPTQAATEYRLYLWEYPQGRWAREARVALLP